MKNPMMTFGPWPSVIGCADLLSAAAEVDAGDVAGVARLRRSWPAELVHAAIELIAARRKAVEKFEHPERMVSDAVGMEQATSIDVARHKAQRFTELGCGGGGGCVVDLCCGIGGDAMALAEVGGVAMIDRDPVRAWMAKQNVGTPGGGASAVADVTKLDLRGRVYHIDPSRRGGGQRKWRYEDYEPGPALIGRLAGGDGAVKLSPGVEFEKLPPGEVEVINRRGTLVQAVLWTGRLARYERTATRIDSGSSPSEGEVGRLGRPGEGEMHDGGESRVSPRTTSHPPPTPSLEGRGVSIHGTPDLPIPVDSPRRYLYVIDPAVERAGLIGELCHRSGLPAVHPALGLLTSSSLVDDPWLTPFELIESMPWRPRNVSAWLDAHGSGVVEVKTRGGVVNTDQVQRELRGEGDVVFTVFVLRFGEKVVAMMTRRVPRGRVV